MILEIILLIIGIIALVVYLKKKKKEERTRALIQETEERKEKAKEEARLNMIEKIKTTQTTARWIEEITNIIFNGISENSHIDIDFDFVAYCQDFDFGFNLRKEYLRHIKKYVDEKGKKSIRCYNFAQYGLPELTNNKLELFAFAFAEVVREKLDEKGLKLYIQKCPRYIEYEDDHNDYIPKLVYKHPKCEGEW